MAVARPAFSAAGCSQCRFLVLNLFTSGIPRSAPVSRPSLSSRTRVVGTLPIRRFSSLPKPNSPTIDPALERDTQISEDEPVNNEGEALVNETGSPDVPWYLQVQPPTYITSLELPPLPEIPPDSPPLISSLLEYASEEMGLDALSLLDLRRLEPSPALGPNLFMLFGTARSERHLNVSAGRLVRWLRAKHRVNADADGLLGPNERKIKLRRRARRAKLLGTMGTDDADDGIRTGWICVNLGTIDRGYSESTVIAEDGRVSGFGVSHAGSTIVFQVMTERRRAEMNLEEMWQRALDSSVSQPLGSDSPRWQKDSKSRAKSETDLHPVEKAMLSGLHRPSGFPGGRKGQPSGVSPSNQVYFYSTQPPSRPPSMVEVDPLSTSSPEQLAHVLTYDAHQKQRLLELLRSQLENMDVSAARAALDGSNENSQSTSFIELMGLAMETLPPTRTWEYRLAVQHKASVSGLQRAVQSLSDVGRLVEELRVYPIEATRQQYLQLLSCIFYAKGQHSVAINLALDVIHTMHQRNEPIMASDVVVSIIEGASKETDKGWARNLTARIEKLLFQRDTPCMDEQLLMRLMTAYANQSNWDGVWNTWGVPARYLRPRSADMYIHIFRVAFASGSPKHCTQVLRRCIPEAASEDPPVLAHEGLRQAALKCIQIADPRAQEFAGLPVDSQGQLGRLAHREFAKLTRLLSSSA